MMDIDTADYDPETGVSGGYKSCPSVYHIKRYNAPYKDAKGNTDYTFQPQGDHWTFQGVEGLFNTYYLYGNAHALERGLMAAEFAYQKETLNFTSETRTIGHTLDGLSAAYKYTWDQKYLDKMIHVWGRTVGHSNTDHSGKDDDWPYFAEFDPYVFVLNTPFQTGIMMGGAYNFRAFSPEVTGRNGIDNILINTVRHEIFRSLKTDVGKKYLRLEGEQMWQKAPSMAMIESSAYLKTLYPGVKLFDTLLQLFRRSIETKFADNNKKFSQAFKFMWSMHYEMVKPELKNRAYASFTAYPRVIKRNETVTFNNQSVAAETCAWDFGDGMVYDECAVNVNHVYKKPGKYTVTLKATDAEGRTDVAEINEYITVE